MVAESIPEKEVLMASSHLLSGGHREAAAMWSTVKALLLGLPLIVTWLWEGVNF